MKKLNHSKLIVSHIFILILGITLGVGITQYDFEENNLIGERLNFEGIMIKGTSPVAAVTNNQEGILGRVNVEITSGTGLRLINTNPFLEPDTQFSANTAVDIAEIVTGKNLDDKNVIIDFEIEGTVLGGPSAGAAMTLATIAAIEGEELENIVITGTILPSGVIGAVGGILEKGQAAAERGTNVFLVPTGQSTLRYYERRVEQGENERGFRILNTFLIPKTVNLRAYFKEEHDLEVVEVMTIRDAMDYAFA